MSDTPFLGELRLLSFNFAPSGWAQCSGQLLPINQNQPLFSLLGTMYGGDGRTTFALPDLRGRAPIHHGGASGFTQGTPLGEEFHTLSRQEMPAHTHQLKASSAAGNQPVPAMLGSSNNTYGPPRDLTTINPQSLTTVGGSQAHENRQPALVLCWAIALIGIFPSRN